MKFLWKKTASLLIISILASVFSGSCSKQVPGKEIIPFGHTEIDKIRSELLSVPTNAENFDQRKNDLYVWSRFLMFSGADLTLDPGEHKGHYHIVQPRYPKPGTITDMSYSPEFAAEIDYQFAVLEDIYARFLEEKASLEISLQRKKEENSGEVRNWPSMRGDEASTGFTSQSGPMKGELLWKFPATHAWYARPAFDDGKIYMGSPGISYESYCIDAESGEYIWKSLPKPGWNPYWKNYSSRSSSPAVIAGDRLVIRKMQVGSEHGVPDEQIVFINKHTGEREGGIKNRGFLTSCVGYTPFCADEKRIIYPHGFQAAVDNYRGSGNDYAFDSLKCNSLETGKVLWSFYTGESYAEPLLDGDLVFQGNHQGELFCINVEDGMPEWKASSPGALSASPVAGAEAVFTGDDQGIITAYDKLTGKQIWRLSLTDTPNAFQQFSKAILYEDQLIIGSADAKLYFIDAGTGVVSGSVLLDDWIRSAPLVLENAVYAASLSGNISKISMGEDKPELEWTKNISSFAIFSDLSSYQGKLFAVSSDFYLHSIQAQGGEKNWQASIFERIKDEKGEVILGDLVGQPDFQSSAIIVDGIAYFGTPRFIHAVHIESGEEVWRFETRGQVTGAPAYADGKIFIGQRGGTPMFYCLDAASGNPVWQKKLGWVWASAHCMEDRVYVSSENGSFWCLDQRSGSVIWKQITNQYSYPVPAFYQNLVYFGSGNEYFAYDSRTGKMVWRFDMGQGRSDSGTSLVKDGIIYIQGAASTDFFALDALTGQELWRYTLKECNVSPSSDGRYLIFCNWEGLLVRSPHNAFTYCIDAKSGEKIYELDFAGLTGSVICNDLVFSAASTDPYFKAWDLATGKIRWKYRMGGRAEESCTTIYGDKAFVVATDGYLYAFH